jgi:hypothetical protein
MIRRRMLCPRAAHIHRAFQRGLEDFKQEIEGLEALEYDPG